MKESSLRRILENKEAITAKGNASRGTSQIIMNRSVEMIKMEQLLTFWVEDCNCKNILLSMHTIHVKAKALYNEVCNEIHGDRFQIFGWFTKYINRYKLHEIRVTVEAASANNEAAAKYPIELQSIVERGGYNDKLIFTLGETGLYWKCLPSHTYVTQKSQVSKDYLTLLLGGNTAGDLKLNHCSFTSLKIPEPSNIATNKIFQYYGVPIGKLGSLPQFLKVALRITFVLHLKSTSKRII